MDLLLSSSGGSYSLLSEFIVKQMIDYGILYQEPK